MSKKTAILILVAVILAAVSLFLWFDSMPPSKIQIAYRIIPVDGKPTVVFYLDPAYPIARIKVTSVTESQTNNHPHSVWELVPESKPVNKTQFIYGENIPGMKPFIPGTTPEVLDPDSKYQLVVSFVKNVRGECTFATQPKRGR